MAVERSELRLVWPAALFAAEAGALLDAGADDDALGGLLAEAFHGGLGEQLLQQIAREHPYHRALDADDPWLQSGYRSPAPKPHPDPDPDPEPFAARATAELVAGLAREAIDLPRNVPRLLFRQRQQPVPAAPLTVAETKDQFAQVVGDLSAFGYFESAFGSRCTDTRDDPDAQGQRMLAERLDVDLTLWPLQEWSSGRLRPSRILKQWPDEVFFDVVEALDEGVARPRQRSWHSFHGEWDYSGYAPQAGQAVYRWRINQLFDRSVITLRLAEVGADAGLLVRAAGDDRDRLVRNVLSVAGDRDERAHAVELFRGRTTGPPEKRSAIVALAGLLEARRALLQDSLLSKDEAALFMVANNFNLRHRRADQHTDYAEAYLDWIFWWYIATLELTDRLLARQASNS